MDVLSIEMKLWMNELRDSSVHRSLGIGNSIFNSGGLRLSTGESYTFREIPKNISPEVWCFFGGDVVP